MESLTRILTCCTAMQSSVEGSTPSLVRISLALDNPSLLLNRKDTKARLDEACIWFKALLSVSMTYFSMAEMCLVSNLPLVSSSGVILPSNSSPSLAIFTRMRRTSSPIYIPLTIFSNLWHRQTENQKGKVKQTHWKVWFPIPLFSIKATTHCGFRSWTFATC